MFKRLSSVFMILIMLSACSLNFASDKIEVLSSNQNTVTVLGYGNQRVLTVADQECRKYGKSARLVSSWGGTRIERSEWLFDCI